MFRGSSNTFTKPENKPLTPNPAPTGVPDLNPETSRGSHASDVCGYLIIDLRPEPDRVPCKSQVEVRWGEVIPIFSIV